MADSSQSPEQSLMRGMGINEANVERRKKIVGITPDDLTRIASRRELVVEHVNALTASFFDHLGSLDDARGLFASRELVEQARALKRDHILQLVGGVYGVPYVEQRIRSGLLYSRAGLESRGFLPAFFHLMRNLGALIMKHGAADPMEAYEAYTSILKVSHLDIGVITDVIIYERERVIRQQSEAIRELSTPVLQVRERMLLLPIIGVIDTHRAQLITENLLRAIRLNRARVVVMDVTGVATIDSKVANHLLHTVNAARLMGAQVIVSGLSADVAQSLVTLGIEVARFNTVGDLQGGIEDAERILGYLVTRGEPTALPPS
jgi:rsbT co-antagonist protein RsbR